MRKPLAALYYVTVMVVFTWSFTSGNVRPGFGYYNLMALSLIGLAAMFGASAAYRRRRTTA